MQGQPNTPVFHRSLAVVFFVAIFTPLLFTNNKTESELEQRTLAPFPELGLRWDTVTGFPGQFEEFFADHFGFRDEMAHVHNRARVAIGSSPSSKVVVGEDDWLFLNNEESISDFRCTDPFGAEELAQWRTHLETKHYGLEARGIEYLFVIAPNKSTIYGEFMPPRIRKLGTRSRQDQLIDYLRIHESPVKILDLRPALLANKNRLFPLYYKAGTHWTPFGASIAQELIARRLADRFSWVIPKHYPIEQFEWSTTGGDRALAKMMNLGDSYTFPFPRLVEELEHVVGDLDPSTYGLDPKIENAARLTICNSSPGLHNLLAFRDSFFTALQPYMAQYFRAALLIWKHPDFELLERVLATYPDRVHVVLEERVERNLKMVPKSLPDRGSGFYPALQKVRQLTRRK